MLTLADRGRNEGKSTPAITERRRGLRIRQCRPVKVYEPRTARYFPGRTADISATGLRVKLPLAVPVIPGSILSLHIGTDKMGNTLGSRRQMTEARVVWTCRDCADPHAQLIAGLELLSTAAIQVEAA